MCLTEWETNLRGSGTALGAESKIILHRNILKCGQGGVEKAKAGLESVKNGSL